MKTRSASFKEKYLIFKNPESAPATDDAGRAERAADQPTDRARLVEIKRQARETEEKARKMREKLEREATESLTAEDLISMELEKIKTAGQLDSFLKKLPSLPQANINQGHIETVLTLCETFPAKKDQFLKKILVYIELDIIPIETLSSKAVNLLFTHFENKPKELRRLFEKLLANTSTTDVLILACKDNAKALDQIFDNIKAKRRLKQISVEALTVLITHYENKKDKLKIIFDAFIDNIYLLAKLIDAARGKAKVLNPLYQSIKDLPIFKSVKGAALVKLFGQNRKLATEKHTGITVDQRASLLFSDYDYKQDVFENLIRPNGAGEISVTEKPEGLFAAETLTEYAHDVLGADSAQFKELLDRLNPPRKKELISRKRLSPEIRTALYNSLPAGDKQNFENPEGQVPNITALAERIQQEIAIEFPGFSAIANEKGGYVQIIMTDAVPDLPENADLKRFPEFRITPDELAKIPLSFPLALLPAIVRLSKIKAEMIEFARLTTLPESERVLATLGLQDKQLHEFDSYTFDSSVLDWEKNWDRISTSPQLAAVLSGPPFNLDPANKKAMARLLKEIVQEGHNAEINLEGIMEQSKVFEAVAVLPEYLKNHDLDREDPEDFLQYFTWLKNRLDEESRKPTPHTGKINDYKQALRQMRTIYNGSQKLIGLIINADLISDEELKATEKVKTAKGTPKKKAEATGEQAVGPAAAPVAPTDGADVPPATPTPEGAAVPPTEAKTPAPAAEEPATIAAIRALKNTGKLEKATTAWDTVEAIYGEATRTRKGNRDKRAEIWAEMVQAGVVPNKPFKRTNNADQNREIRKYLKNKLKEVQAGPAAAAPVVEPIAPAVPPPPTIPAAPAIRPEPAPAPAPVAPAPVAAPITPTPEPAPEPAPILTPDTAPALVDTAPEPEPEPEPELNINELTTPNKAELLSKATTTPEDKQKLFDSLLNKLEELAALDSPTLNNIVLYAAENDENLGKLEQFLAKEAAKPIIAKLSADSARILLEKASKRKKEALVRRLSDNLAPEIVEQLINDPTLDEKILEALAPAIAKLIKKLNIERKDGKYRRKQAGKDTYYPGSYRFSLAEPAKVLYEDNRGVQSAPITDSTPLEWKWESRKEKATAAAAETTPTTQSTEQLHARFFQNFDTVRETTRKITPGKYQLANNTLIHQEKGPAQSQYERGQFDYLEISDPKIYKITKNGKTIYVVKADRFLWKNPHKPGASLEPSPGDRARNIGFVNIEDLVQGHDRPVKERKPAEVDSEWTQEPKLTENETIIKDKVYSLKEGTDLYTVNHRPSRHLRKDLKVKVIDTNVREVEGKEYVAVEVDGLQGWVEVKSLVIPPEDAFFMSPGETPENPITKEEKSQLSILGTHKLKGRIRGSDLLHELFEKFKDQKLEEKLLDSGIAAKEYLEALQRTREDDTINVLEPKKTLAKLMHDYERQAINPQYKQTSAKEKLRIYRERKDYFDKTFRLTDPKLKEYIDNDEKWNNLWDKINEQGDEFIDGIETIIAILGKFGKKDIEVKDDLRELLQKWCNQEVSFEEVFDRYIKGKLYKNEDGEVGDFDVFREEFEQLATELEPWSHPDAIKAFQEYDEALSKVNKIKHLTNWTKTPEYAEFERARQKRIGKHTVDQVRNLVLGKQVRLAYLRTEILEPITTLLGTIETLKVKVSAKETFYDKHQRLLESLPEVTEPKINVWTERGLRPILSQEYFDLQRLSEHKKGEPVRLEDAEIAITAITVKQEVNKQFDAIAEKFGIKKDTFNYGDQLKIIFELYSLDTLAKEGCLSRIKGKDNKFILSALPASFNAENPKIKELFTKIKTRDDIDTNKKSLEQLRKSLDQNAAVLARLNEVFGEDRGMDQYFNWREKLEAWFTGDDTREITLTMSDIGAQRVTKPTGDFLRKYMSGNTAISYILPKISTREKGVETYDNEALKTELKKRLRIGLDNLFVSDQFQFIRENVLRTHGKIDDPKTLEAAYEAYSKQIDDFDHPIDIHAIQVIRIGEVLLHVFEENKEEVEYSASPEIRQIQEALIKAGYSKANIKKVESVLLGGVIVGVNGEIGLGAGVQIDLGDGWTLTPAAGVSSAGIGAGAGISKTAVLSTDGRTTLTVGIHGGYLAGGGHATLKFPISDTLDGRVSGAAGITAIGFYAGGGIGLRKNTNAQQMKAFGEAQKKKGFTETAELIKKGASATEIAESMFKIPAYGAKFKELKTKYNLKDEALRELFITMQDELESKVTGEFGVSSTNIEITEGGVSAGVINGLPVVIPYIVLKLGEEFVVIRSVMPGYENMHGKSDDQIQQMITEQVGHNIKMLRESTGETGHVVFDSVTGKLAVLESGTTIDLHAFNSFEQSKKELKKIRIDISKDSDGITLETYNTKAKPGNIKYSIDPTLGYNFTVKNSKLLIAGIKTEDLNNLIITREDFYYPNEKDKSNILSIITIKSNPARTRTQIEKESTHFLYKGVDHRLEIRRGIARTGRSNIIEAAIYETAPIQTGGVESFDAKHFEEFRARKELALKIISRESFDVAPRSGVIPQFADKFYEKNKVSFRALSTIGIMLYNPTNLIKYIQQAAAKTELKALTNQELNQVMLYLTTKSFMNAKDKKKVFERNLKFAEKEVLTPMFEKIGKKLRLANTTEEMAIKAKEMAAKVTSDLRNTDFTSTNFETFALGTLFLSTVGTMKIAGLRGTPYYSSELDLAGHILNFKKYNPAAEGVEGDIGKALLALLSPMEDDPEKFRKFLMSPLAIKLAAHDGIYLILGDKDAIRVMECFKNQEVSPENRAAFEKFRQIVLKVRETQNRGGNFINLPNGYQIRFKTEVGMGVYDKCTNPSMAGNEVLEIMAPRQGVIVAGREQFVRLNAKLTKKDIEVLVGVRAVFEDEATKPAPAGTKPQPRVQPKGDVRGGPQAAQDQQTGRPAAPTGGAGAGNQGGAANTGYGSGNPDNPAQSLE